MENQISKGKFFEIADREFSEFNYLLNEINSCFKYYQEGDYKFNEFKFNVSCFIPRLNQLRITNNPCLEVNQPVCAHNWVNS